MLCRELGRFPTLADVRVKSTYDDEFPSHTIFDRRLGRKADSGRKVAAYCSARPGYEGVLQICGLTSTTEVRSPNLETRPDTSRDGFVYLMKSGRFYKIGKTNHVGRRERELSIQLPEQAKRVHEI